jgi:hypothetical protein
MHAHILTSSRYEPETSFPCGDCEKYYEHTLTVQYSTVQYKINKLGAHLFSVIAHTLLLLLWSLTKHVRISKKGLGQILEKCRTKR